MLILTIRTDKPGAEIGLYKGAKKLAYKTWQAHRELSSTLHLQIAKMLQFVGKDWSDIGGLIVYQGPGSFTGLRIGVSVANTLAYAGKIPIVSTAGDEWIKDGVERLGKGENEKTALPHYGAEAKTTTPRK